MLNRCAECTYDPDHLYHSCKANPMNSAELHQTLSSLFAQAENLIRTESDFKSAVGFSIYAGQLYSGDRNPISFTIRTGYFGDRTSEVEVKGTDFWDCVQEFVRRLNFAERQKNLQLGPPVIDQKAEPVG